MEDEPEIRRILRVLLESESYRVVEAETAARAAVEARAHKPDLRSSTSACRTGMVST